MHEDLQQQQQQQQQQEQLPQLKMHGEAEHDEQHRGESQVIVADTAESVTGGDSFTSSSPLLTLAQSGYVTPAPPQPPSTVVNLSNSTDVVIGPMTQYQGPVSIYYMDASLQTAAAGIHSAHNSSSTNLVDKVGKKQHLTRNKLLLCLLLLLVLATAIIVVFVELTRTLGETGLDRTIYFGSSDDGQFPNLGNGHLVIEREQWGATEIPSKLTKRLKTPIPYVLITHVGVQSKPCDNLYRCSIKMRTYQDSAVAEKRLPDIQSNFYVSDEGNIYVGRGWDWANTYANNTLAITFMGDYGRYNTTAKQLDGVHYLLAHAVANRKLAIDYKLVAQNQTKVTKSPGARVYCQIKHWPHFYPCGMNNNSVCGSELGMTAASWMAGQ